jgi:hypothetical protein
MAEEDITSQIENLIPEVLEEMLELKDKEFNGEWRDAGNPQGIILASEALLCFLSPAVNIPNIREKILSILPLSGVEEALNQIILWTEEGFFGSPYINFSEKTKFEKDQDFSDSACFVVSALLYAKKLFGDKISPKLRTKINKRVTEGLKVINESHLGKDVEGWSWGRVDKPDEAFLYSSWTALETVTDLFDPSLKLKDFCPPESKSILKELEKKIDYTKKWIEQTFILNPREEEGANLDMTKDIIAFNPRDRDAYYNLYATISLLLTKSSKTKEIEKALNITISEFFDSGSKVRIHYLQESFDFYFDGKEILTDVNLKKYSDRTFLPLLLKCISLFIGRNPQRMELYKPRLLDTYEMLLENRDLSDKYTSVWDKGALTAPYSIYYTERAIEALMRIYTVLNVPERESIAINIEIPIEDIAKRLLANEYFISALATRLQGSGTSKEREEASNAATIKKELEGLEATKAKAKANWEKNK